MKRIALALAFAALAGSASAVTVTIDFEELMVGQQPGNSYINYGITFTGGTIANNRDGNYVAGNVGIHFSGPVSDLYFGSDGISLDAYSRICFVDGQCEPFLLESSSYVPYGPTYKRPDWYEGKTYGANYLFQYRNITDIYFNTVALDNLRFTPPTGAPVNSPITTTVPEPGSIALLGLGALGLLGARRRKAANSKNA